MRTLLIPGVPGRVPLGFIPAHSSLAIHGVATSPAWARGRARAWAWASSRPTTGFPPRLAPALSPPLRSHLPPLAPLRHSRRASPFACAAPAPLSTTSLPPATPPAQEKPSSAIRRIQREVQSGQRTALQVAEEYLTRLAQHEGALHSFVFWDEEQVLSQARGLDARVSSATAQGEALQELPALLGVPVALKDNLCSRGMPATAGSRILEGYKPPYDASAVKGVREQGAVLIGKTNMDEFGMGSSCEQSAFGPSRNPWANDRVPGGSSGGSAAAVAAGQCAVALGSDTGGSVRQPASFCGVVGLKPTYGRVSRSGLIAYASSLDVVGCVGPTVEDVALLLNAIAGHDAADATSARLPAEDFTAPLAPVDQLDSAPLSGVRLGLVTETLGAGVEPAVELAVRAAVQHLQSLGAQVEEVSLPHFSLGLPAYYILATSEASSNLARYDGVRYGLQVPSETLTDMYKASRGEGFGPEVKRRILMGTYALSAGYYDAFYKRAQQVRRLIQQDFSDALQRCDVLLTPTTPTPAYRIGEKTRDPLSMYIGDLMTVNVNLSGLPAMSVPCGFAAPTDDASLRLPVGLQLIGRAFREADVLKIGHVFEQTNELWSALKLHA